MSRSEITTASRPWKRPKGRNSSPPTTAPIRPMPRFRRMPKPLRCHVTRSPARLPPISPTMTHTTTWVRLSSQTPNPGTCHSDPAVMLEHLTSSENCLILQVLSCWIVFSHNPDPLWRTGLQEFWHCFSSSCGLRGNREDLQGTSCKRTCNDIKAESNFISMLFGTTA
jgi:hypothetical protein